MKNIFIVNPKAGQGKNIEKLTEKIKAAAPEAMILKTTKRGDAGSLAREMCEKAQGKEIKIFSCGGDGTFCEVVNGVAGYDGVSVGIVPIGTGNDFVKNFGEISLFENIENQLSFGAKKSDLLKITDDTGRELYCSNMINIGFDCNVADYAAALKKKPFISGSFAYLLAIFAMLIKKKGARLKIFLDGKEYYCGALLLNSVANGMYCGGGIKSNPDARTNDGMIDVNIIHNVSRISFIKKLPFYIKGTFKKLKKIEKTIESLKCRSIKIKPLEGKMKICVDGEIMERGVINIEVAPNKISFIAP